MNALFLITETIDGTNVEQFGLTHHYLKDARNDLMEHLNRLASNEEAYEMQPTMNFKDRFHFWVGGEKRHIVISKFYTAPRCSIRMVNEAKEKIKNFTNPI